MCSHLIPILAAKKTICSGSREASEPMKIKDFLQNGIFRWELAADCSKKIQKNTKMQNHKKHRKYKNTDTYFLPDSMRNSFPKYKIIKWNINFIFATIFGILKHQILKKICFFSSNQDLFYGSLTGIAVNCNIDTLHDHY